MALPQIKPRPLPYGIVVVAFPNAYQQSGQSSLNGAEDFFFVMANPEEIQAPGEIQWLTLNPAEKVVDGLSKINYQAQDNAQLSRALPVPITVREETYYVLFNQQAGYLVQDELVRTLNCPLTIDFQVAIKFIADLIKKIPIPPIKLIVMIIAILVIIALGFIVSAIRHAFVQVPEPDPLSRDTNGIPIMAIPGVNVSNIFPIMEIAAEDQTIALQTVRQIYWLIKQAL